MPNWKTITEDAVKGTKVSDYLETMRALAENKGEADPLPGMITAVISRIRAAISTGNSLDADFTKIPNSLEDVALRMVVRRVKSYCGVDLDPDEKDERKEDASYLNRITDQRIRFEIPDSPADSAEMQNAQSAVLIHKTDRQFTREKMRGL